MQHFPASDFAGSDVDGMPIPLQSAKDLLERMIALPMLSLKVFLLGLLDNEDDWLITFDAERLAPR